MVARVKPTPRQIELNRRLDRLNALTVDSVESFNRAMDAFSKKLVPEQHAALMAQVALEALKRIVNRTPVDTGRARGNWRLSIGKSPRVLSGAAREGSRRSASQIISQATTKLQEMNFGQTIWIANGLEYVVFLEAGSSTQAPRGMVAITIRELEAIFA